MNSENAVGMKLRRANWQDLTTGWIWGWAQECVCERGRRDKRGGQREGGTEGERLTIWGENFFPVF